MKLKMIVVSVASIAFSLALFPLLAIGGLVALFLLALGAELLRSLTGAAAKRVDRSAARAMAMRICYSGPIH